MLDDAGGRASPSARRADPYHGAPGMAGRRAIWVHAAVVPRPAVLPRLPLASLTQLLCERDVDHELVHRGCVIRGSRYATVLEGNRLAEDPIRLPWVGHEAELELCSRRQPKRLLDRRAIRVRRRGSENLASRAFRSGKRRWPQMGSEYPCHGLVRQRECGIRTGNLAVGGIKVEHLDDARADDRRLVIQ